MGCCFYRAGELHACRVKSFSATWLSKSVRCGVRADASRFVAQTDIASSHMPVKAAKTKNIATEILRKPTNLSKPRRLIKSNEGKKKALKPTQAIQTTSDWELQPCV